MKKNSKISFLIPAHNEEKIIAKTLDHLIKLPYNNYEIIIGLDGCTDKTEEIVKQYSKKSKKIRYYKLNLRQGKPEVIDYIIKKSKGEIIVINDADWKFQVENEQAIKNLIKIFENKKIGGIAESFPLQYPTREKVFLEAGVGVQTAMWMNYNKKYGQKLNQDWIIMNESKFPMLVNIFRKELYNKNKTLGDDFERFFYIVSKNKLVLATYNPRMPRMISIGEKYTIKGIFKQKERTAIARKQIGSKIQNKLGKNFAFFVMRNCLKLTPKEFFGFIIVNIIFTLATIKAIFKKPISTKEGWKMRLTR